MDGALAASFGCAGAAAFGNAVANVAQRKASLEQDAGEDFSLRLLSRLVRRRVWLLGFGGMVASFLLQAIALDLGPLSAVEPVITLEVPLTLLVGGWVFGSAPRRLEWLAILAMTAGAIGLIGSLDPRPGSELRVSDLIYVVAGGATVATIAALVFAGTRGHRLQRAAFLGAGAGASFGFTATMVKETARRFDERGALSILSSWQTYAAVAFGLLGVVVMQWALRSGPLLACQPGFTLMDPMVSVLWGVLVFGEQTRTGWWLALSVASMAVLGLGVVRLASSPLLASLTETEPLADPPANGVGLRECSA